MGQLYFRIKKETWDYLVKLRCWQHPNKALSERTGWSVGYCSQIINGQALRENDMLTLTKIAGASPKYGSEWSALFEIVENCTDEEIAKKAIRRRTISYQRQNYAKFFGQVPYDKHSLVGSEKKIDRAHNLERLSALKPIPAVEFYDDEIVLKKYYYGNKYKR